MNQVLILGGYGNFGSRIAAALVKDNISIIIAGRERQKAEILRNQLKKDAVENTITIATFDANKELSEQLDLLKPAIVINTIGPFQTADYSIAKICIQHNVHYIDLADARDFVTGINCLDSSAKKNNVLVVSGASTVPGLSSAVLDHYKNKFATIDSLIYGISPGQKAPRGLATTESILTYLGKPLKPWGNHDQKYFGWQDIYRQEYPELGKRWMANCDIPDLDLFTDKYGLNNIRFSAGMENSVLHLGMWALSYLVRIGLPLNLPKHAKFLLSLSHTFDSFGTTSGGMHMLMKGTDKKGKPIAIKWFIIAKNNDGPQIPCIPAIILSKKIIEGKLNASGAIPCVGMVTLDEYMKELEGFSIKQHVIIDTINGGKLA
ncbi:MAG: saccharopine dehydrogenase NADP-binding domain-containing protein [Gammaproteobacteria bacterium]